MQKHTFLFIVFILVGLFSCQKPAKKFSASQFDPNSKRFEFLRDAVKDAKVLALGESSHGFGSMHTLKSNLVQYLHKDLGYEVLVMEAGYGDVGLSWYNIDKSTDKQLINSTIPANLRSKQMLPLFTYLHDNAESEKPLELRGMDTNISGTAFRYRLMWTIRRLEPKVIQDSIENGLYDFARAVEYVNNEEQWEKYMTGYLQTLDFAKSIIDESREDIIELEIAEEKEIELMINYINMLKKVVDYDYGEMYSRGLHIRDSMMAVNVFDIVEKEFPNTKIIVWGHNGHIEKGPGEDDNMKWLGHYLKEKFGDEYYALGMFAKKGFIYQTDAGKTSNFELKSPSFIETKIRTDYGKNVFLDIPPFDQSNSNWVNKPIDGYELEAGGQVRFIPSKRFDGILFIEETEAPDYKINEQKRRTN
ncbi:MAG: erythromycin esterase family protein [Saprospiraceae bacterium]|nr:erythromycin esterase family protein [Saprospiraceae bacterium]